MIYKLACNCDRSHKSRNKTETWSKTKKKDSESQRMSFCWFMLCFSHLQLGVEIHDGCHLHENFRGSSRKKTKTRGLSIHNFRHAIVEIFNYNIHRLRNWTFNICIIVSNTNNVIFRYSGKLSLILVTTSYS